MVVAVEIAFDVQLIMAEHLVAAQHTEEDSRAGGRRADALVVDATGRHGDEIGRETVGLNHIADVVPSAHTHTATDAHGQLGVAAHEHEIRRLGVLEATELVVVVLRDDSVDAVGLLRGIFGAANLVIHGVGCYFVAVSVDKALCLRGGRHGRRGEGEKGENELHYVMNL